MPAPELGPDAVLAVSVFVVAVVLELPLLVLVFEAVSLCWHALKAAIAPSEMSNRNIFIIIFSYLML